MAKSSDVSKERVFESCRAVRDAGARVTFERVYERLGRRGSAKVVQDYIALWQTTEDQDFLPGLPPAFVGALRQLGVEAFAAAMREAETRMEQRRAVLEQEATAQREACDAAVRAAQDQAAAAENERLALEAQLAAVRQDLAIANERGAALTQQVDERDRGLATLRGELATKTQETTALAARLDATAAQYQAELRDERLAGQQALNQERERGAGERQHLMEQTDRLRQDKEREVGDLKVQLQALERRFEEAREKLVGAGRVEAELRTALTLIQKERQDGQARELDLQQQLRGLTEELASERRRLAVLEDQQARPTPATAAPAAPPRKASSTRSRKR